jgi:hypothetical protein
VKRKEAHTGTKSALGLASARERRQRADVPLRRDVNDNRSPKKKMRLDVH